MSERTNLELETYKRREVNVGSFEKKSTKQAQVPSRVKRAIKLFSSPYTLEILHIFAFRELTHSTQRALW